MTSSISEKATAFSSPNDSASKLHEYAPRQRLLPYSPRTRTQLEVRPDTVGAPCGGHSGWSEIRTFHTQNLVRPDLRCPRIASHGEAHLPGTTYLDAMQLIALRYPCHEMA